MPKTKLADADIPTLMDMQRSLGAERADILARQREVQGVLDKRIAEAEAARIAELDQVEGPATQDVFEVGEGDVASMDLGEGKGKAGLKVEE